MLIIKCYYIAMENIKRIAIDNNILVILVGIEKRYQFLIEKGFPESAIRAEHLISKNLLKKKRYEFLMNFYLLIKAKKN